MTTIAGRPRTSSSRPTSRPPAARRGSSWRRTPGEPADAVTVLTVYLILLIGLPSTLIVSPLGAAGTPANIFGMLCLLWWTISRFVPAVRIASGWQPIRACIIVLAVAVLASYLAAMTRAIPHLEINSADRGLLNLMGWAGVALLAADGVPNLKRLRQFVDRMVIAGAALAAIGIIQYTTNWNPVDLIKIPGLHANHPFGLLSERSGLKRVTGTTSHPIELGVVLAMLLPFALHHAFHRPERGWLRRWLPAVLIVVALPMPVARSAVIGSIVALLVLLPSWPLRRKLWTLVVLPLALLAMRSALPGLLGTLKSLFLQSGNDPSIIARQADYAPAWRYITERPIFGRGFQTFLPETYRTLDNAYLGLLIEAGFFGFVALLAIQFVAVGSARGGRRRAIAAEPRDLGQTLAAAAAVPIINLATFDGLGFPMCAGLMFLIIGLCGAYWRLLARPAAFALARPVRIDLRGRWRRYLVQAVVVGTALIISLPVADWAHTASGSYLASATMQLTNPNIPKVNQVNNVADVPVLMESLVAQLGSPQMHRQLAARGVDGDYRLAVGSGSLERDTDRTGSGAILSIVAVEPGPEQARAVRDAVVEQASRQLQAFQDQVGVRADLRVSIELLSRPDVGYEHGSPSRAVVAVFLLVLMALPLMLRLGAALSSLWRPATEEPAAEPIGPSRSERTALLRRR